MKWIISNLKDELVDDSYKEEIKKLENKRIKMVVCPNDKQLLEFKESDNLLGSQDIGYTYNIEELKKINIKYCIVGHSDKRKKYRESNREINDKIKKLLENNICPILCIGEKKVSENVNTILEKELVECLEGVKTSNIIIAYEPIWAIASGKIPTDENLNKVINFIKYKVEEILGGKPTIVYGGSVNQETISLLEKITTIDGYLIGSASTKIESLRKIIEVVK